MGWVVSQREEWLFMERARERSEALPGIASSTARMNERCRCLGGSSLSHSSPT